MSSIVVWRITSLWFYKSLHKYYGHGTQTSYLNRTFKSPDFKFIQIKYMCVYTYEYTRKCIQLYLFYLLCVCVWYEYICMHMFLAPGAGSLAICIPLGSASITVLTLYSSTSCSSMATQDALVLGELQQVFSRTSLQAVLLRL